MYLEIEELKKQSQNTVSMVDYGQTLKTDEPTIVLRNYNEPTTAPCMEEGVKILKIEKTSTPDVAYGGRPNVPGINVINAVKAALGAGSWCLHISDGSYTGYRAEDLIAFLRLDKTNLRAYIGEVFDCDDFAQVLQGAVNAFFPGIALGTIWYGDKKRTWGHAVNIFYDYSRNKAYLIEPQNDAIYEFNKTLWNPWVVML